MAKTPGNKVGISIGYCCAVRIRISSIVISGDGARSPPLSTVLATTTNSKRSQEAGEGRPRGYAELLQGRQGCAARGSVEVIRDVGQ